MKVLSIGNSFSEDAQRWLHPISKCGEVEVHSVNLYIGGCSLERHYFNLLHDKAEYDYQKNETVTVKKCSIKEALSQDTYDVLTLQQVSGKSGQPQTFFPYLTEIVKYLREVQPQAKLYYHQTWSYEVDSTHEEFVNYHCDQGEMLRRITDCALMASNLCGLEIIPSGEFVQYLRENTSAFRYGQGGESLTRDGYHLSYDYGRFAVAALWYQMLTGENVNIRQFSAENPDFRADLLHIIVHALEDFLQERNEKKAIQR